MFYEKEVYVSPEDIKMLQNIDKGIGTFKKRLLVGKVKIDEEAVAIIKYLKLQVDEMNAIVRLVKKA